MSKNPNTCVSDDPAGAFVTDRSDRDFKSLIRKLAAPVRQAAAVVTAATARIYGFDLDDNPLICALPELPGEVVPAQTTIPLSREQVGSQVVLLFDRGDVRRPIVVGVVQGSHMRTERVATPLVSVQADDQRVTLSAEREIVLRCGDASITLTRAGKVLIQGKYILSRSSGYNKIKGAAVDIN